MIGEKEMKKTCGLAILAAVVCVILGWVVFHRAVLPLALYPKTLQTWVYTCGRCGSTQSVDRKYFLGYIPRPITVQITYRSPGYESCPHEWHTGVSFSPPDPVPDDVVVLIRENGRYGAFILRHQTSSPERAEYDWWYPTDGSGLFATNSPTVSSGHGTTPDIKFGSFNLDWSVRTTGSGWLYFKHCVGEQVGSNDLHLCLTNLKSVSGIDAADTKWKYKATPAE